MTQDNRRIANLCSLQLPERLTKKLQSVSKINYDEHGFFSDRSHYNGSTLKHQEKASAGRGNGRLNSHMSTLLRKGQKFATTVSYKPLLRETNEMRLLREHNRNKISTRITSTHSNNEDQSKMLRRRINKKNSEDKDQSKFKTINFDSNDSSTFLTELFPPCESNNTNSHESTNAENKKLLNVQDTRFAMNEETPNKIMMQMDSKNLEALKLDFINNNDTLSLEQFVQVMMKYQPVSYDYDEKLQAASILLELFSQVDINGDGTIEWDEFTSFIIDSSQDADKFRVDTIKNYNRSSMEPYSCQIGYGTTIDHIYYLEEMDQWIACEGTSKSRKSRNAMHVYDASSGELVQTVKGHTGVVHGVDHLHGRGASNYVVTCANDSTIGFWDAYNFQLCQQMPVKDVQTTICYSGIHHDALFTGDVEGTVNVWDIDKLQCRGTLTKHTGMIMDLHNIPRMDIITSASLDSQINLWDIPTLTLRKSLCGHSKGVLSLSYAEDYRFLISAGFDHDVFVWNPYVEHLICRLSGHLASLVGVHYVPNSPEIISADSDGVFKIWDVRNFSCVQTFSIDDHHDYTRHCKLAGPKTRRKSVLSSYAYCSTHKRIVAGHSKLQVFDHDVPTDPMLSDELPSVRVLFNHHSLTLVTGSGNSIKLWDAESGRILRIYRDMCTTEITAMCMDDRCRKIIIGDHEGNVHSYNVANGSLMNQYQSHQCEIMGLHYCGHRQLLVSCSWDGTVKVHDESDPEATFVTISLNHYVTCDTKENDQIILHSGANRSKTKQDISNLAYSERLGLVSTSSSDKTLCIWNVENGKPERVYSGNQSEITDLTFIEPHPILLTADSDGNFTLWHAKAVPQSDTALLSFRTENCSSISCVAWDSTNLLLYAGMESGQVECYSLEKTLQELLNASLRRQKEKSNIKRHLKHLQQENQVNLRPSKPSTGTRANRQIRPEIRRRTTLVKAVTNEVATSVTGKGSLSDVLNRKTSCFLKSPTGRVHIPSLYQWKAHDDGVRSIELMSSLEVIGTTSHDRMVYIWTKSGDLIGRLYQGSAQDRFVDIQWSVDVKRGKRDKKIREDARYILTNMMMDV